MAVSFEWTGSDPFAWVFKGGKINLREILIFYILLTIMFFLAGAPDAASVSDEYAADDFGKIAFVFRNAAVFSALLCVLAIVPYIAGRRIGLSPSLLLLAWGLLAFFPAILYYLDRYTGFVQVPIPYGWYYALAGAGVLAYGIVLAAKGNLLAGKRRA